MWVINCANLTHKIYVGKLGNAYMKNGEVAGQTDFFYGTSISSFKMTCSLMETRLRNSLGYQHTRHSPQLWRRHHRLERHQHDLCEQIRSVYCRFLCTQSKLKSQYHGEVSIRSSMGSSPSFLNCAEPSKSNGSRMLKCAQSSHTPILTTLFFQQGSLTGTHPATITIPYRPSTKITDQVSMRALEPRRTLRYS